MVVIDIDRGVLCIVDTIQFSFYSASRLSGDSFPFYILSQSWRFLLVPRHHILSRTFALIKNFIQNSDCSLMFVVTIVSDDFFLHSPNLWAGSGIRKRAISALWNTECTIPIYNFRIRLFPYLLGNNLSMMWMTRHRNMHTSCHYFDKSSIIIHDHQWQQQNDFLLIDSFICQSKSVCT